MKGGHQFFTDLVKEIKKMNVGKPVPIPLSLEFVRLKSYIGDQSSGEVQIIGLDSDALKGKVIFLFLFCF